MDFNKYTEKFKFIEILKSTSNYSDINERIINVNIILPRFYHVGVHVLLELKLFFISFELALEINQLNVPSINYLIKNLNVKKG